MTEPTRLAPLEAPFPAEVDRTLQQMMPKGLPPIALFRTLAHNPRILHKLQASNLLDRGALSLREREIVILRTTARCGSSYEWGVHVAAFTHKTRLTPEQIAASALDPDSARWEPRERLLIELVDELHDTATWSGELFQRLRAELSTEQLLELVALVGLYHTVSFFTNAFAIAPEPGAPQLPAR